jgi:hypothetical protein
MLRTGRMRPIMIMAGVTASVLVGAAARAGTVSFGTNGGSYSFNFDNDGGPSARDPQTTSNPAASFARAPFAVTPGADRPARTRSDRLPVGTNGGSYSFDH